MCQLLRPLTLAAALVAVHFPPEAATGQPPAGEAADWPQFRGPGGLGVSAEKGLPVKWGDGENVAWKAELPGAGTSSPVVYGGHIYLTCHTGYGEGRGRGGDMDSLRRFVLCLDRDGGKLLWKKEVASKLPESEYSSRMLWHGYASSTPAADADGVYCFFGRSGVVAFDHEGKQLWHAAVGDQVHGWGSAASPVLYKDLVIINAFVECGDLVALDRKTGQEVWRHRGLRESWNTPLLVPLPGGQTELVVGTWGKVLGLDPGTGEQLWSCAGHDWYTVGSMVTGDGVVYCTAGRQSETLAVRAGGRGDVTATHLLWRARAGSNVSSPVLHGGRLYVAQDATALAQCLDAKTGAVLYKERLPRSDEVYASPIAADGKVYFVSRTGGAFVLAGGPGFELLAHNRFEGDGSVFNASPAASRGQLLLRSDRFLYCLGAGGAAPAPRRE